jgi:rhamnosyltransferase subunit B
VVFVPGSTLVNESAYWRAATEALDLVGARGVFLGGRGALLSKGKSNILARPYAPLSRLLPYAKALVHHGGIGTVSQAFAAGTPQLITPFAHDQFDNAARVERLGCGFEIHSSGSALNMHTALKRLLEDQSIQQNCAAIRSKVETGEVSCRKAMTALERIAAGAFPSIRSDSSCQGQPH